MLVVVAVENGEVVVEEVSRVSLVYLRQEAARIDFDWLG